MKKVKPDLEHQRNHGESHHQALARSVTSPECLSASLLTILHKVDPSMVTEMVDELRQQSVAVHTDDLSRPESMLIAQAHSLDGLFGKLASQALMVGNLDGMERYMRLALKAQIQSRATLQTLAEIKAPKQIAFVKQANIGNQVQVNNKSSPARTRAKKKQKVPNELLEVQHGERLDTRAQSSAGGADSAMAPVGEEHRADQPGRQEASLAECLERWR